MAWKFDTVLVDLVWVVSQSAITSDGANVDLGSGDFEIDMMDYTGDGEIDQGERTT